MGYNALGDTICTTPVLRAYKKKNPRTTVIYILPNAPYCRVLDANPNVDVLLYNEQLYFHGIEHADMNWLHSLPLDLRENTSVYHFDMKQIGSNPNCFNEHISVNYSKLLNIPIDSTRPQVEITAAEFRTAKHFTPKPYFVFCMHSVSNPARGDGNGRIKDWPLERWLNLAAIIRSRGDFDIFAVGAERDTRIITPLIRNLYGLPIKIVAALFKKSLCVVSLENGLAHLCAAVDAPLVEIYPSIIPRSWAEYHHLTHARVIYDDPQAISCQEVMEAVQSVLKEKGITV